MPTGEWTTMLANELVFLGQSAYESTENRFMICWYDFMFLICQKGSQELTLGEALNPLGSIPKLSGQIEDVYMWVKSNQNDESIRY